MIELCANNDNREKRLDLVPLLSTPSWQFDQNNVWHLPGAHGEEIVRSVYLDEQVRFSFFLSFFDSVSLLLIHLILITTVQYGIHKRRRRFRPHLETRRSGKYRGYRKSSRAYFIEYSNERNKA